MGRFHYLVELCIQRHIEMNENIPSSEKADFICFIRGVRFMFCKIIFLHFSLFFVPYHASSQYFSVIITLMSCNLYDIYRPN